MGTKSEVIYARLSTALKKRLEDEVNDRGEAEAVIIREALREYFEKRDRDKPIQYPPARPSPGKLNDPGALPPTADPTPAAAEQAQVEDIGRKIVYKSSREVARLARKKTGK